MQLPLFLIPVAAFFAVRSGASKVKFPREVQQIASGFAPDIPRDDGGSACDQRPDSHICDPEHLLTDAKANLVHSTALRRLAEAADGQHKLCPEHSYEVYVALLNVPAEGIRAKARELGGRWGVLGGSCGNGIMALYSTRENTLSIVADPQLEAHLLMPHIESYVERASTGLGVSTPEDVMASFVETLGLALHGKIGIDFQRILEFGADAVFCSALSGCLLAAFALMVCCAYDTASQWKRRARYQSCRRKVQQVHEILISSTGDLPLCPCCVELLPKKSSPSVVVFLCGHRFHVDCANRWLWEHECKAGICPICEGSERTCKTEGQAEDLDHPMDHRDESKGFIVQSLRKQYPEIFPDECVQRWSGCHTGVWLDELIFPV